MDALFKRYTRTGHDAIAEGDNSEKFYGLLEIFVTDYRMC
jgi:hypothetical protein